MNNLIVSLGIDVLTVEQNEGTAERKKNRRSKNKKAKGRAKLRRETAVIQFAPQQPTASLKLRSLQELVLWVLGLNKYHNLSFQVATHQLMPVTPTVTFMKQRVSGEQTEQL